MTPLEDNRSESESDSGQVRRGSRHQDAIRLLFLLDRAGMRPPPPGAPPDSYSCILGQTRLQALDFWIRNPDYLADELLNEYESGHMDDSALVTAERILRSEEPDIRRYPMIRWLFGAYEPLDDALAILASSVLIKIRRHGSPSRVSRHDYFLRTAGHEAAEAVLQEAPPLAWYAERANLVASVARGRGGAELKEHQYRQREYGATRLGSEIAGIKDRVLRRLLDVRAA